jgi:spore germination protein KC
MKTWTRLIAWTSMVLLLTGCWSKMELPQRAFVIAIAIDKGEKDDLELTMQIYKPVSQFGVPSVQDQKSAFINVTLTGTSIFNIIRDNSTVTGRRSQFSHTQIILISEEIAKENLVNFLDFFYRDPEVRLRTDIMIVEGKAREYLKGRSLIENTLGSQIQKQLSFSADIAGNTINGTLLDLAFQLKSESASALLPYMLVDPQFRQSVVRGIAVVKKDKMVGMIEPDKAEYLLMLADRYKYGVIEIPCAREADVKQMDTIEILNVDTTMTPVIHGHSISVRFDVQIDGSIGELVCTSIRDMKDETKFAVRTERYLEEQLENVFKTLQAQKTDALGIGHKLFLRHPAQWKKIKPDWEERYAQIPVDIRVKVTNANSKMSSPTPVLQTGED